MLRFDAVTNAASKYTGVVAFVAGTSDLVVSLFSRKEVSGCIALR